MYYTAAFNQWNTAGSLYHINRRVRAYGGLLLAADMLTISYQHCTDASISQRLTSNVIMSRWRDCSWGKFKRRKSRLLSRDHKQWPHFYATSACKQPVVISLVDLLKALLLQSESYLLSYLFFWFKRGMRMCLTAISPGQRHIYAHL